MSGMNTSIILFWKLLLIITVGIKSEKWGEWTKPPGGLSSESSDHPFKAAFIQMKPGLFQLDVTMANRLKLQQIINDDDLPRWPNNRRSDTNHNKETETTTVKTSKEKDDSVNHYNENNINKTLNENTLNGNATYIPYNSTHPLLLISLERNKTKPHYEVTTESEDIVNGSNKEELSPANNSSIVPLK